VTPRAKEQPMGDPRPPVKLVNPRDIRALAHPARLAVIEEIYSGRELTATECAEIAGLSPSAMSYHLRSLEKAGIVERADAGGDARERPWRAAGPYLQVDATTGPGGLAASAALNETVFGRTLDEFNDWLAERGNEPPDWRKAGGSSSGQAWLLPDEVEDLQQAMLDQLERYRGRHALEHPPGARRVRVATLVFPIREKRPRRSS
jgi:DNA-binding transcriptional ArsR family regulator